jgi:Fic-DOC domain mobile mystery protein B
MTPSDLHAGLPDGATPIDPDEAGELIPSHIRTQGELNVWEQENILSALSWVRRTRQRALDEATIRELHRRMFSETWRWAGRFRTSDKNIGIHWAQLPVAMRDLVEDGKVWLREGVFSLEESALRLHHRLVQIHPFPNGNGRHARLWCDMLLEQTGGTPVDWRGATLDSAGENRKAYIGALRSADRGDFGPLLDLFLPQ